MVRRPWVIGFLALLAVVTSAVSSAAYTASELACRQRIAKDGTALFDRAAKLQLKCHKLRSRGKVAGTTDCNDIAAIDTRFTVASAAQRLVDDANQLCQGLSPSDLHYLGCPSPCDSEVPALSTFQDVADCVVCAVKSNVEIAVVTGQGNPDVPLLKNDAKCNATIGSGQYKLMRALVRERTKCQNAAENAGATDTSSCLNADPTKAIQKAESTARLGIDKSCAGVSLLNLDACTKFSLANLKECVLNEARIRGRLTFRSFYDLDGATSVTTSTVTSTTLEPTTTTTTLGGGGPQDPRCPNLGELTLLAGAGGPCTSNADCLAGSCDTGRGRCVTQTELDTGWTGIAHDADINDKNVVYGRLNCPGPAPVCGACQITGVDPKGDICRCANDNRTICDQPFAADADDCGGETCDCYFGAPLPLSSGNVAACVVNRFALDISGTTNVDTGAGSTNAQLASVVYLGETGVIPCPVCGGTCSAGKVGQGCGIDADCDTRTSCATNTDCANPGAACVASVCTADGACGSYDPTPSDGVRGGICFLGRNAGASCDIQSINTTFPAPGGGGLSLDCFPSNALNVSGTGLSIKLTQSTGSTSLAANVLCGFPGLGINLSCPCGNCSAKTTQPCTSNAECVGFGTCVRAADGRPMPNRCDDGVCSDLGAGEGQCNANLPDLSCDGVVRANGEGIISCQTNADCDPAVIGVDAGACSLGKQRKCFLDPIQATGSPDPSRPLGVATFCVAATSNSSINLVAGLPGPGRIKNQGSTRLFCASNPAVEYEPGIGGCP
jgi:hypothetical protein